MSRAFTSVNMDDIPLRNTQRINNGRANGFSQDNFLLQLFQALFNFVSSIYAFILEYMSEFSKPKTITVNSKPFRIIKQLGEGGFSFVYLVAENNGRYGESMALKKIKIQLPEHETRLLQEIACHKAVSSFHVLKLLDSEILKNNQGQAIEGRLLLPFYPQGTVQDLIDKSLYDYIPIETVLKIIIGLCRGLEAFHTHQPPLAFRDLKPANILLNADGESILMDLGSVTEAKVILNSRKDAIALQDLCSETVTAPYRPPELFDPPSQGIVTFTSDLWSLGCVIFALCFKSAPFDGSMTATVSGKVNFPIKQHPYPPPLLALINSLIQVDPSKRPSLTQVRLTCESLKQT